MSPKYISVNFVPGSKDLPTISTDMASISLQISDNKNTQTGNVQPNFTQVLFLAENEVYKQGYLTKRGNSYKSWKRRWFVLKRKQLLYYKAREYPYPQGTITQITAVTSILDEPRKGNCFAISTPIRQFFCFADTEQEMQTWIACIESQVYTTTNAVPSGLNFASAIPHGFSKYHFDTPTKCMYCKEYIWGIGKQGFLCKVCNFTVHKKCMSRVANSCKSSIHQLLPTK